MKQSVTVQISDVGQARKDADNLVQLTIVDPNTKMPFLKLQVQRVELAKLMHPKFIGHLDAQTIDGYIVT